MRNLTVYPDDSFQVFVDALERKEDVDLRARLDAIRALVQTEFDLYKNSFDANSLETIIVNPVFAAHKADLLSLYAYDTFMMRRVRTAIENCQPECIRYTCPYCGLDTANSLDHYLPKGTFPIFCVNPINLVPACQSCNGAKSEIWLLNGARAFLNPYLDILPDLQYLFVNVGTQANGDMNFEFLLRNLNGVDANLFSRIEVHFNRLGLLDRMRKAASGYVTEFLNTIRRHLQKGMTINQITNDVLDKVSDDRAAYGANYWKSALEKGLIQSAIFLARAQA